MKMKALIILAIIIAFVLGFLLRTIMQDKSEDKTDTKQPEKNKVTLKKVTGIGGVFFKCKDPEKLMEWYKIHLGFETDQYGTRFEWFETVDSSRTGSTQWSLFSETETYFDPSTSSFMINYRVNDLVSLVEQLKNEGVVIVDSIETYEYGKFIHILDPEGNKIELWEPDYNFGKTK